MSEPAAVRAWAEALASWAIPPEVMAQAPEDPWALSVSLFAHAATHAMQTVTPSRRRALEALPDGGVVLDVGCGAGAGGLALAERAALVVGVDKSEGMLRAFEDAAAEAGVEARAIQGRWPDAADDLPAADVTAADVVVCHHVLYNVPTIEPFIRALTEHARFRVVVEITADHPRAWMNPFWQEFWGIERPERPTADDAMVVLRELGIEPSDERWPMPSRTVDPAEVVAQIRRYLCLPVEREPEVAEALARVGRPEVREVATIWWDV